MVNDILVFVYGTLKKEKGNDHLLDSSTYLGEHITEPIYTMYSAGGFPILCSGGLTPIVGEVYSITSNTLKSLDSLEGYPEWYQRRLIDTRFGKAWVYTQQEDTEMRKLPVITTGEW